MERLRRMSATPQEPRGGPWVSLFIAVGSERGVPNTGTFQAELRFPESAQAVWQTAVGSDGIRVS